MPYFKIIKIDATDSTNLLMRQRYLSNLCEDGEVLSATSQIKGRGQHNSVWKSETGKNLTFSVYRDFKNFSIKNPFLISCLVSLSVKTALESFSLKKIKVKWPNDIMSHDKKLCGLLIENIFKGSHLSSSIIGIGLNVNQKVFKDLPNASSMYGISGQSFDLDEVLNSCLVALNSTLQLLEKSDKEIIQLYEKSLYRMNKPSTFKVDGILFTGVIKGVTKEGLLKVQVEDDKIVLYNLKSIKLMN
jgi:BirA family biotin operon repressor/biotin-[acetyl-CoA-carboxylase] ligase